MSRGFACTKSVSSRLQENGRVSNHSTCCSSRRSRRKARRPANSSLIASGELSSSALPRTNSALGSERASSTVSRGNGPSARSPPKRITSTPSRSTSASTASSACTFPCTSYSAAISHPAISSSDALALAPRGRPHDLPQRARDPCPGDRSPCRHRPAQRAGAGRRRPRALRARPHLVGVVHEPARKLLEQVFHGLPRCSSIFSSCAPARWAARPWRASP